MGFPPTYVKVVEALLELYSTYRRPIKSKEIAAKLNMNEGTVRNIMVALKAMNIVESKTGPYGGFIPSQKASEFVKSPIAVNPISDIAQIYINGSPGNLYATSIELINVYNPYMTKAVIKVLGNIKAIKPGDNVRIGPTMNARVIIEGVVLESNQLSKEVTIVVKKMLAIPKIKVIDVMTKDLIFIREDEKLAAAARVMAEKRIRALPVINENGDLVGLITTVEVARAYSEGKLDLKVKDLMRRDIPVVDWDSDIYDAMRLMLSYNIGRLIVLDQKRKPIGIVTRTDLLKYLAPIGNAL